MKEFVSQTGGRYTYIDDIINLQELSLAFSHIFDGCENFIISGCNVSGTNISSGFVYINGKIRYCSGTTGVSKWPMYIYENNSTENVSYVGSLDKAGRELYGCALSSSVPITNDKITGKMPQFIMIEKDGNAQRIDNAFFGKYALLINPRSTSQTVNKPVKFTDETSFEKNINVKSGVNITRGNSSGSVYYGNSGELVFQSKTTQNTICKLLITDHGELKYYVNDVMVISSNKEETYVKGLLFSEKIKGGNIALEKSDIYNEGSSNDDGILNINMLGYHGANSFFRNTCIGDGKGKAVMFINGKNKYIDLFCGVRIKNAGNLLTLTNSNDTHSNNSLSSYIAFDDKNAYRMAEFGYTNTSDKNLYIKNNIGSVVIGSDLYCSGNVFLNNVSLANTFVDINTYKQEIEKKANADNVYSKSIADDRFINKTDSISVFVDKAGGGDSGKRSVCDAIGACSKVEFNDAVLKSQGFKDIVSSGLPGVEDGSYATKLEERQRSLCSAIGAAYHKDISKAPKDTGWITVEVKNCGIITKVYARQVGHVVSIQGELHTHHSGTIFTLPNNIDPPKYKIGYSHNKNGEWHCVIEGGKKDCVVDYCNAGCSEYIGFLLTYLV